MKYPTDPNSPTLTELVETTAPLAPPHRDDDPYKEIIGATPVEFILAQLVNYVPEHMTPSRIMLLVEVPDDKGTANIYSHGLGFDDQDEVVDFLESVIEYDSQKET